jgi:hypothetical protein
MGHKMGICQHSLSVGLFASLLLFDAASALGGLMVSPVGTPLRIGFDDFRGRGLAPIPTASQLNSNHWRISGLSDGPGNFGDTHDTGDFARGPSSGGVTTGGVYGFDVGSPGESNWALGFQPIGSDLTPGAATLKVINATGMVVDRIELAYDVWLLNNGDRSSSIQFAYSMDDRSYQSLGGLSVSSALDADTSPGWQDVTRATILSGLNLVDGSSMFLRWWMDDVSGRGSRDEWALDQIEMTWGSPAVSTVPEPSSWLLLALLCPAMLWRRRPALVSSSKASTLTPVTRAIRTKRLAVVEPIKLE